MELRKVLALRGPNIWARFPVLEAWLDLGVLKDSASCEMPGFNDRLKGWLPSLIEHRCSLGQPGGFFERLNRGTYLAHILEHVALELQALAGYDVGYGKTRETHEDGVYKLAVEYGNEAVGRAAVDHALELCLAAVDDRPFDVAAVVAQLQELAAAQRPAPIIPAIQAAAKARNVPILLLDASGLMQLGYGRQQRRLNLGQADSTSAVATWAAYDQETTLNLLRTAGVPVPEGWSVADADTASQVFEWITGPVVFKPRYATRRHTISAPAHTPDEARAAYERVRAVTSSVIVERYVAGHDYRLLVIGSRVVAAARRGAPTAPGVDLPCEDVTATMHPSVAARAIEAARVVGLDIAGIDVVCDDIGRPLEEQGGVITAVRAKPGLKRHLQPDQGEAQPIGAALVDHLFPKGQTGRIPVVAVTGTNGKTTTTRLIAHLLGRAHGPVGLTCTEGIYLGQRRIHDGDCSGPQSARMVLQNPLAGAAVLETARGGILREGLGFDCCDVAVVTNIGAGDHLGSADIETPEQLAYVKSTIVHNVAPEGWAVLNATDPLVMEMARYCRGQVIVFALRGDDPVLTAHRANGGRALFTRGGQVILADGPAEVELVGLDHVPLTHGGRILFQVENVLAAVAAAWALDVPAADLRAGLASFAADLDHAPGRFNLLDIDGITVVLDYGHNVDALTRVIETLTPFPHGKRTAVYSASGDRRDDDLIRQGELLGNAFDQVVLYEDTYLRGRQPGEIFGLFRQGLSRGQRVQTIHEVRGGLAAIEAAFAACGAGELLHIQPDIIDDAVAYLKERLGGRGREIHLEDALTPSACADAHGQEVCGIEVTECALGRSVRATRSFAKGEKVLSTWGQPVPRRTRHSIQVGRDLHIVAEGPLIFFNHSCEPNCGLLIRNGVESMEVHALRDVAAGEELCLDYATFEYEITFMSGPCLCGTPGCRGSITGYKSMPRERRQAYGVYIAEHLRTPVEEPAKPEMVRAVVVH